MVLRVVVLGGVLLAATACDPPPNVNVAHDPDDPETFTAFQSEQSLVRTVNPEGEPLLVMGLHDSTGQTIPGSDGRPAYIPNYSIMGLAISSNDGASWTRRPQFTPPPGLTGLRGDPWLATNGPEVWYVMLASTSAPNAITGRVAPNAIAFTHSSTGGETWDPIGFYEFDEYLVDKCSVAVSDNGQDVYIAYLNQTSRHIEVLVSNDAGATWNVREIVPSVPNEAHQNPIVRVTPSSPQLSYVVFQAVRQGESHIDVSISGDRGASYNTPLQVDPTGASLLPATQMDSATGVGIRNFVWQHFAVQPESGRLFVTYEHVSQVWVQSSSLGVFWSAPVSVRPDAPLGHRPFQPTIAASSERVGVVFYEQGRAGTSEAAQTVVIGASSADGVTWGSNIVSRTPPPGEVPFEPCPTDDGVGLAYFGDYIGLVPLADPGDPFPNLLFYGAWTDSRDGCINTDRFTATHHHTVGTPFL